MGGTRNAFRNNCTESLAMPDSEQILERLNRLEQEIRIDAALSKQASVDLKAEVVKLTHLVAGNGRPGLVLQYEKLQAALDMHADRATEFVTQAEYRPVKAIVFGAVSLMLTSVFLAVIALVVKS